MREDWAESHGYTQKCAGCGQTTDSTFCSVRCELDERARAEAERDDEDDMIDGPGTGTPYGDAKHEPAENDRERKEA